MLLMVLEPVAEEFERDVVVGIGVVDGGTVLLLLFVFVVELLVVLFVGLLVALVVELLMTRVELLLLEMVGVSPRLTNGYDNL